MAEQVLAREIEALIKQRKKEAEKLNIYGKARLVAVYLGSYASKKHGGYWIYRGKGLVVCWDTWAPNLWIDFNGVSVFYVHLGDVERYRPDIDGWIELLEEAYSEARAEKAKREAEDFNRRLAEMRERWGL